VGDVLRWKSFRYAQNIIPPLVALRNMLRILYNPPRNTWDKIARQYEQIIEELSMQRR